MGKDASTVSGLVKTERTQRTHGVIALIHYLNWCSGMITRVRCFDMSTHALVRPFVIAHFELMNQTKMLQITLIVHVNGNL